MDEFEKKPQKPTFIPETERWVLYDSKSNPGRKYYFNPVTKQKLWHHTDDEIKKKEKKVNEDYNQTDVANTIMQVDVSKKNEANSSELTKLNRVHPDNPLSQWNVPLISPPFQYTIPLIPQNLHTSYTSNPFLSNQIASQSTQAAFINFQAGAPTTINQMQNITRFEMNSEISTYNTNRSGPGVRNCASSNGNILKSDLRYKLTKRKHLNSHIHEKRNNNHNTIKGIPENVSWNEEIVKHILSYFKGYISPNTKPDMWCVVPETNVILKHSRLLTLMRVLDDKCHLIIPSCVRTELKPIENIPGNEAIGRLIRFSFTSPASAKLPEDTVGKFYNILDTCRYLTRDKYHVVLLCDNDQSFLCFKKRIDIPVFTVEKIIQLHHEGRLIPRQPIASLGTEIVSEETPSNAIQKDNKVISDSTISEQCGAVKDENISTPDNLNTNKPSKRRLIKLNATYDENPISGQPTKRKRWSAYKNKCQDSSSTTLPPLSNKKCGVDMLENVHQDNTQSQAIGEEIDSPLVELSKHQSEYCDTLSSCKTITTAVESASNSNVNCEGINSVREEVYKPSGSLNFLQIFINVLLKVLNQDQVVIDEEMPQLQRLYEASLDIIKNFIQYGLIVDAANKLSMKITQATQDEIKMDQKFYNDIHSYGVNLLKTLQEKSLCPTDIQNALNLLENESDKSCLDGCCNNLVDVARDQHQEVVSNDIKDTDENFVTETMEANAELTLSEESISGIKKDENNTDLSNKRKLENPTHPDDLYYTTLKLRKTEKEGLEDFIDSDNCVDGEKFKKHVMNIVQEKCIPLVQQSTEYTLGNEGSDLDHDEGNCNPLLIVNDNDCYKTLEDDTAFMETDYKNISLDGEITESNNFIDENESKDILKLNSKSNEQFKHFIGMFLKEVREALLICVHNFEMCVTHQDVNNDLSRKFRKVRIHLYKIRRSLDRILQRETSDVNNNFKSLLNKAGVDIKIDQSTCDQYREIVHKYRNEVDAFLKIMGRTIYDRSCEGPLSPQHAESSTA